MALRRTRKPAATYTSLNRVELVRGGKPYFDRMLEMIGSAKNTIHLQTYIFDGDETGKHITAALIEAVKRKVKVYFLADGYASKRLSKQFVTHLKKSGIHFRFFSPLFKSKHFYFGRRLHHKIIVVDTRFAMAGGINITNRYNDLPDVPAWLDFALYVEGEAAKELCVVCWETWRNYPRRMKPPPCDQSDVKFNIPRQEACDVRVVRNDWVRRKNDVSLTYINMLRNAKSHVIILCAYFLPGRLIRHQIRYAVSRGVNVKVITAGASDVKLAKRAERFMYDWLLRHNIELYEYQPVVLHGKIAVCDGQWMTGGSYNINDISAYASIELNLNVRNEAFAKKAEDVLLKIVEKDCVRVTKEYHKHSKNIFKQFIHWLSFIFFRLMFYLSTFYFKHKE
ncbi:MAG: phosphatidylserine/phosphatidylglycerophosphate/cardiolipin synthase family protein [Chitinophagales bacterium]